MNTNVAIAAGPPNLLADFLELRRVGIERHETAAAAPGDDAFEFVMSDNSLDRMGDVIEQNWVLSFFRKNPVALFNHRADNVIGKWANVRVEGDRLLGRLELAAAGTSELVDTVRALVAQKVLRAVSVGFRSLQKEKLNEDASEFWGPFRFLKSELLECSLVAVPANANALSTAKSLSLPEAMIPVVFREPASNTAIERAAITGKPAKSLVPVKGAKMSTLSQKITAQQQRIVSLRDKLSELAAKDQDAITDDERTESTELPDIIEAEQVELKRLERMERSLAPREQQAAASWVAPEKQPSGEVIDATKLEPARPFAMPKKKIDPADYMFKAMAVGVKAFQTQTPVEQMLRDMYGRDELSQSLGVVLRAAVNPAQTTVAGWAAELTQTVNVGFLDRLIAASIYGPLSVMGQRYDLGRNSKINIPTRTATDKASGAWVGEGAAKPVKKLSLTQASLYPHKLAVICTFTEEMAQYSTPAIENVIRTAMVNDTGEALDGFLIDNVAENILLRPPGLLNGAGAVTPSAATPAAAAMVADLKALVGAIIAAGGGSNVAILLNPKQALSIGFAQTTTGDFMFSSTDEAGRKFNARFLISRTVPADRVIAVDAEAFATVTGDAPRFAVSTEATIHEDDAAGPISAVGTPNVVAAPIRSLFQTDSVAIRLSLYVSWKMLRAGMVQTASPVIW